MSWWQYLLLVNIYLVLFYAFYVLLLRKETFFQLNRIYLVTAALLSFFIPLIQVDWVRNLFITQQVKYTIYSSPVMVYGFKPMEATHISIGQILAVLYGAGILFLSVRLIWQLIKLKRVINQPQATAAYSFFKKVKLNEENADNLIIEAHEQVHAQQWHSADVLLIELIMIINWFNPVVYMYRFAIKHIHEYIADRQAVQAGTNKAEYALLLLSQTFNTPAHQLVNPFFNHSLLKQRIIMLQKNKSQRISLIKYGLSAPLFILMLILSSATINNSKTVTVINNKAHQIFLTPATPVILGDTLTGDKPEEGTSGTNETAVVDTTRKSGQVFTEVEQVPEFPGGLNAFGRFLGTNVRYPKADREKGIQGRVIATFVVETDGSLSGLKISRGISKGLDEESLRVLRQSPNWKPGIQNGKKVRVQYSVPISFTLADGKSGKPVPDKTKEIAIDDENASQGTGVIYTSVEQVPEFPGGLNALGRFLGTNIRYPKADRDKGIQGRVILTFVVEADGSLSGFKILKGVSPDIDAEALRVMAKSPKWEPGVESSKKVRVQYSIPISFTLADDKSGKPASNKTGAIKSDNNTNTYANVKRSKAENDSVLIRRSLTGPGSSNEPLYVLDGKEITAGDMKMINPNTIQSINVIKDKSAATIYGDKGANGVVVITSKGKKKAVEPTKYN